jgi:hypothetical protein
VQKGLPRVGDVVGSAAFVVVDCLMPWPHAGAVRVLLVAVVLVDVDEVAVAFLAMAFLLAGGWWLVLRLEWALT